MDRAGHDELDDAPWAWRRRRRAMCPHPCSNSGASDSVRWSTSKRSYGRDGLDSGVVWLACEHGGGIVVATAERLSSSGGESKRGRARE